MDITTRLTQWAENDMRAEGVALDAKYEIERLRKENTIIQNQLGDTQIRCSETAERLFKEIERLRRCVKDLLHYLDIAFERSETDLFGSYHNDTMDAIAEAKAALQQNGSE